MSMPTRRRTSTSVKVEEDPHGRSTRNSRRGARTVSYAEEDDEEFEEEPDTPPPAHPKRPTRRTRGHGDDDDANYGQGDVEGEADGSAPPVGTRRSSRAHKVPSRFHGEDDFEASMVVDSSPVPAPPPSATGRRNTRRRVVVDPDDDEDPRHMNGDADVAPPQPPAPRLVMEEPLSHRSARNKRRSSEEDAESFNPSESEQASSSETEADGVDFVDEPENDDKDSFVSVTPPRRKTRQTRSTVAPRRSTRGRRAEPESDDEYGSKGRNLRKRDSRPNYQLPPMDISAEIAAADMINKAIASASGPRGGRRPGPAGGFGGAPRFGLGAGLKPLPWSMKGKDFAQAMGDPDSSDSDNDLLPKASAAGAAAALGGGGPGGPGGARGPGIPGPTDVPNFGRVNPKSNMADADPLGVDVNVTFDRVGGLDGHINQLKEMVALPLLYPELFQQFGIIPPRGVLFHGPPGTGKTLLARALAASCSNGNQKIAFFMRKGADVLSKWVGEAERQLRMLFEEARASQPSIIFFDEIDGLAPVRSSKQDQIHASLVSTLLALMDGMDGRGQVIVIGATNRPDAVDPALRRPGRFDREFYFPLPNRDARHQIIKINTRQWEPQLPDNMIDTLATLTKGYGGADLRALCTEAALNAIQRKYPQIYKSTDRLQVQPGSVHVQPKDFMLAVKKIVPSSARSTSSAAIQLPNQLVPLLANDLERLKLAVDLALPRVKKRTALEEAEFEDDDGDSFEKEMMLQSLDQLRTYRPRLLVYGAAGSGQTYLGPAILHHLEGFHVQSFDLASLMGDSTRTPEAAIVQMFVEAKRHQPSIIFIPSLGQWSETLSETARSTTRALLDGISPSDPVLLLAIVDGPVSTLPPDVRAWFGFSDENRIQLGAPTLEQRGEFFQELIDTVQRPPTAFPDGVARKKRVLEELPIAAPLPPRKPTEVEIQREVNREEAARQMLYVSFSSLISELCRKYKRPVHIVKEEAFGLHRILTEQAAASQPPPPAEDIVGETVNGAPDGVGVVETQVTDAPGGMVMAQLDPTVPITEAPAIGRGLNAGTATAEFTAVEGAVEPVALVDPAMQPTQDTQDTSLPTAFAAPSWQPHDMDLDIVQRKLTRHKYYTPAEVLADIALIEENARHTSDADRQLKVIEMAGHARIHVQGFDPRWTPEFENLAVRMRARKADRAAAKAASRAATRRGSPASGGDAPVTGAPASETAPAETATSVSDAAANGKRDREGDDGTEQPAKRAREDGEGMDVDPNGTSAAEPAEKPRSPTPEPEVVDQRLVVPTDELEKLGGALKHSTGQLNVEELEQLRASLLDRIWRARQEWDRTALLSNMREAVSRFVAEAADARAAAEME
ncbi:uncharacterized protein CcaverHIS019_0603970 [Cutaneotrichosporon cavernicola]|uniref:AAA+ ATPase domain-containing protein n=1 Tax=Cutaneotrichosporon cavernicola TaxID=279322 RepID=A0AA48L8J1_9TREE|nr:uncharacterized protein CcaverHIS019_0603970 [Cutaneotrichosporon cavernicola]BEI93938.1 hypothetical protein CcaverHIS019_0603970 [Cutaneotrichosporon cavernicola]BEJ01718.1 hypothetical protein CcaverHIS631_0604000 [Cutaneotrichosporon cavernicola]BEJ09485.1 hypothetical protein CcaverHIS641_0604000 [Cutaneotrichosporon cavernicola]